MRWLYGFPVIALEGKPPFPKYLHITRALIQSRWNAWQAARKAA